jgi:hypothetical protein
LASNITINYYLPVADAAEYDSLYIIATLVDKAPLKVEGVVENGKVKFSYDQVSANLMNDIVYTDLYGVKDGETYLLQEDYNAGVVIYGKKLANYYETYNYYDAKTCRLLADLLEYGSAAQIYNNYKTNDLANAWLPEKIKAYGTTEVPTTKYNKNNSYVVVENPEVTYSQLTLLLGNSVTIKYVVNIEDTTDLVAEFKYDGLTHEIPASEFVKQSDGKYAVEFSKLNAAQMKKLVHVTFKRNGVAVSNTYQYSVESYVNEANTYYQAYPTILNLANAIMKYGNSASAYNGTN